MRTFRLPFRLLMLALPMVLLMACSDDDNSPVTPKPNPDFFPMSRSNVWTYQTNAYAEFGYPSVTLEMKFDTLTTEEGKYTWQFMRVPNMFDWTSLYAVIDSGNVVYGVSDDGPFPLFRHVYVAGEATDEDITVQGKTYKTKRYEFAMQGVGVATWWFADGVGLVREYSPDGLSLFADDQVADTVVTELVNLRKQ